MKIRCIILCCLTMLLCACMQEPENGYENTARGNVEALWNIIDKKYCFVEEKGVDWQAVKTEYLGYADSVKTGRELFDLLSQMLDNLHDGHVNIYTDFDVSRNRDWYKGYPEIYNSELVYGPDYLTSSYHVAGGMHYNMIADSLVGLIRYPSFSSGFGVMNMLYVLMYFSDCEGIVLDVRQNGGGSIEYAKSLASTFFSEQRQVGWWSHKTGEGHYDLSKPEMMQIDTTEYKETRWTKPVVVICDRGSYSATNYFVNAMRYADNCTIIGVTTGGGGGMPMSYELPCGWMVRFSSIKMYDKDMVNIEEGINPDVQINSAGTTRDTAIDKAVEIIKLRVESLEKSISLE